MTPRSIVLDANIIIRAVLGTRVALLLTDHANRIRLFAPDIACAEAREHLPTILKRRGESASNVQAAMSALGLLVASIEVLSLDTYGAKKEAALVRIGGCDPDDWPVMACSLLTGSPVWTEDRDFFGTGVTTWMTALVELYFTEPDFVGQPVDQ